MPAGDDEYACAWSDLSRVQTEVGGTRLRVEGGKLRIERRNESFRDAACQRLGRDLEGI